MHASYFLPRVLRLCVEKIMWEKRDDARLYYSSGIRHLLQLGARSMGLVDETYTEFKGQIYICPKCSVERGAPVCVPCVKRSHNEQQR
jgi:hypothetical protein